MKGLAKDWLNNLRRSNQPDEFEVKELLRAFDIDTPRGSRVGPDQAIEVEGLNPPFAVKVCSPDVLHKTDRGGVLLNVGTEGLDGAVNAIRGQFPDAAVLVEEQAHVQGPEMIIGALIDSEFGPAIMVGAGGILTELLRDVTFRLAPCTAEEARQMLRELKIAAVFDNFRGLRIDADALAEIISRVASLTMALGDGFSQLDINPIAFADGRWVALDARLVLS